MWHEKMKSKQEKQFETEFGLLLSLFQFKRHEL